ncbi:MAG: plastocyanin/azurin family copper-binding protein [Bacteroidota bacterium]
MKKAILSIAMVLVVVLGGQAQEMMKEKAAKTIKLEQTPGEFTQKQLTVKAGTYVFDISNVGVGHDVGFVLVKKGLDISKPENHIQTAYVIQAVKTGEAQQSKPTTLEKGEYVYFCPLNPTETDNTLIVQ